MSTAERIAELGIKFEENPRRYFAPLANEYRKSGDLTHAIALCREHLPKQPGHMSGYIVFGQALFEANELDEARTVFEQALGLDPENLIALRHLGEIAKAQGERAQARRWFERVLDADPRNDDIAALLESLATNTPPVAMAAIPAPVVSAPVVSAPIVSAPVVSAPVDVAPSFEQNPVPEATEREATEETARSEWDAPSFTQGPWSEPESAPTAPLPAATSPLDDALKAFATFDPTANDANDLDILPPMEEAWEPVASATPGVHPQHEPLDLDFPEDPTPVAEELFEEGLIAPEWPDTSDLVARVTTPVRAATPISVPVSDETVNAFGREVSDPVDFASAGGLVRNTPAFSDTVDEVDAAEVPPEPEAFEFEDATVTGHESVIYTLDPTDNHIQAIDVVEGQEAGEMQDAGETLLVVEMQELEMPVEDVESAIQESVFAQHDTSETEAMEEPIDLPDGEAMIIEAAINQHEETAPAFMTETMAELLVSQGFTERAIDVYEELVRRRPYDPVLSFRLSELRDGLNTLTRSPSATPIRVTPVSNTPHFSAPVNATPRFTTPLHSTSFSTPFSTTPVSATPLTVPALDDQETPATRRTARARFAELARRRVPRRTPPHATVVTEDSPEGLAALFGSAPPTTTDELAARALAEAFGPVTDSGESLFDTPPMATPIIPMRSLTPRAASQVLTPPVHAESRSDRHASSDFSFDRFFPDPALPTHETPPAPVSASMPTPAVSEDLAQFSAWLKGLSNS